MKEITKEEFDDLKQNASEAIIRDRYNISSNPDIAIQVYHGKFEGLIRVEVEFETQEKAMSFQPLDWMGEEMTGLPIARDSKLLDLTSESSFASLSSRATVACRQSFSDGALDTVVWAKN